MKPHILVVVVWSKAMRKMQDTKQKKLVLLAPKYKAKQLSEEAAWDGGTKEQHLTPYTQIPGYRAVHTPANKARAQESIA